MWMTNRERIHRFVESELLPHWGVEIVAHWFWHKIGTAGKPVSSMVRFGLAIIIRPYPALLFKVGLPCLAREAFP